MNLGDSLVHNARIRGDKVALLGRDSACTWRQWNDSANRVANALLTLGARHGDRVLLLLGNEPEFLFTYYGAAKIGCISAPVMPRTVGGELVFIAKSLRVRYAVVDATFADLAREVQREVPSLEAVIGVGKDHGFAHDYDELLSRASPDEPRSEAGWDDLLTVKFTSGTTGTPKGCLRTHGNFISAALGHMAEVPIDDRDTGMVAGPLAAGMAFSQLTMLVMRGVRIVLLPFEPGRYLELVHRERPTLVYLTDGMSRRLFAHPDFATADLSSIRLYHAVTSRDIIDRLRSHPSFKGGMTSGYACSEGGGLITIKKPALYELGFSDPEKAHLIDCLGHETLLNRVECLDDNRNPVPANAIGEIAIRGPSVFQGYWELPEETERVLRGGWLLTGDLGYKDADGYLHMQGRTRDVIRSGGLNVYPAEVEAALLASGSVAVASVIGVPDLRWGERVVACVIPKAPSAEAELIQFCKQRLAYYKCPKAVFFFDKLPITDMDKISKKELIRIVLERESQSPGNADA